MASSSVSLPLFLLLGRLFGLGAFGQKKGRWQLYSHQASDPACGVSLMLIWNLKANCWQFFWGGDRLLF
jgi:hypothetical protein